jgi:YidC/Oxa1 family membrane protein insertase
MQKLSPQPADGAQAKMMLYFFPAFFTFIMIWVPGGLTLYIVVNNVLTIIQQRAIKVKTVPAKA